MSGKRECSLSLEFATDPIAFVRVAVPKGSFSNAIDAVAGHALGFYSDRRINETTIFPVTILHDDIGLVIVFPITVLPIVLECAGVMTAIEKP